MPKFCPDSPGQPTFRPQFPVRMSDMQLLASQAQQSTRNAVTGDDNDMGGGPGHQAGAELMPEGFWARLTTPAVDSKTPLYSFCEVQDDGTGMGWTPPHAPLQETAVAHEANNNTLIPVPGPPTGLSATPAGESLSYVVTATWQDTKGNSYQSAFSNEVGTTGGGGDLTWTAPAACAGFTLTGYQIWRSLLGRPGVECVLVASVSSSTTTYADVGYGGTLQMPIPGGTAGPIVWMSPLSLWSYYKFTWSDSETNLAWVRATSATPTQVYLGRTVTDAVENGTTTLTSASANFTSDDVGATLIGSNIPAATTISSVTNSTTIVMSNAATSSASGVTVQITTGSIKAYAAVIDTQSSKTGVWADGQTVWLQQANDSVWQALVGGQEPVSKPVYVGDEYQCRYFCTAANNVPIWTVAQTGITVTDGTNTATDITTIKFTNGTVSNPTAGEADVSVGALTNGVTFSSAFNTTTLAAGTWTTWTINIALPSAGTYLLWASIAAQVSKAAVGACSIEAILYDSTNAVQIGVSAICCEFSNTGTTLAIDGTGTILFPYVAPNAATITVQLYFYDAGGGGTGTVVGAGNSGKSCSAIGYVKIG